MLSTKTVSEMRAILERDGIYVGERFTQRNQEFDGKFMVAENINLDIVTNDAGTGGFCIVGDNLDELIIEAYQCIVE